MRPIHKATQVVKSLLKAKVSSCSRVVGVVQENEADRRVSRDGKGGGASSSVVEEVVLERISIGNLSFQTILVDGSEARVIHIVLCELVTNGGGERETNVVQFKGVGVTVVWSSREGVWDYVVDSSFVLEVKVVFLKQLHPAGLTTSKLGLCGKVTEGGVVGVYSELGAIEVVAPGAKGVDDS